MKFRVLALGLSSSLLVACAGLPLTVNIDPAIVAPTPKPPATPPAPVEPPVVVEPAPVPEPPPAAPIVWQDLKLHVRDAATKPIATAVCTVNGERRPADGGGFIHFPVPGPVDVACEAPGYVAALRRSLPPGDQNIDLASIAPPAPPVAPTPPVVAPTPAPPVGSHVVAACGANDNAGRVSDGCLGAVADRSINYPRCQAGDAVACHRYVREVALALRTTTGDPGWGLITKFQGQGCTLTRCSQGLLDEQKYGEDMVAYLPKGNPTNLWTGIDVIIGAGAPGARYGGGVLPPAVGGRPDNLWAPVP